MTQHDLRRVEDAATRAAGLIGRRMPAIFPTGLHDQVATIRAAGYSAGQWRELNALDHRAREGAVELLKAARKAEADALAAQAAAVEALRHLRRPPSWDDVGELTGLSRQGAHKRFRDVEAPLPQTTIDEELDR